MSNPILMAELAPQRLRGGVNRLRWLYVALLLVELAIFLAIAFQSQVHSILRGEASTWHRSFWDFYSIFYVQHVVALAVLAPIFAAGSIAREKALGTFELLLTTELTDAEIVLGKWISLLFQTVRWTLPAWPLLAFFHAMLGLPGWPLLAWLAGTLLWTAMATTIALGCSALMRNGAAALAVSYLLLTAVVYCLLRFADLGDLVPWDARSLSAAWRSPSVWAMLLATSLPLAVLAGSLRPLHRWQTRSVRTETTHDRVHLPPVSDEPIYWKQRWLGSAMRLPLLYRVPRAWRRPLWIALACAAIVAVDPSGPSLVLATLVLLIAVPSYSALVASAAYSGEREQGTWESLLATPLRTYDLVEDHHRAISARVREFWMLTLIPVALLCTRVFLEHNLEDAVSIVASLIYVWGVAWVASPSAAASGLRCSAKASTMWRSLFATVGGVAGRIGLVAVLAYIPASVIFIMNREHFLIRVVCLAVVGGVYWYGTKTALHDVSENDLWKAQLTLFQLAKHRIGLDTDPVLKRKHPRRTSRSADQNDDNPNRRTHGDWIS